MTEPRGIQHFKDGQEVQESVKQTAKQHPESQEENQEDLESLKPRE